MKKWILTLAALWAALFLRHITAQVSINPAGTPSDPSAMLNVTSTSKGLLIPRVSTAAEIEVAAAARNRKQAVPDALKASKRIPRDAIAQIRTKPART